MADEIYLDPNATTAAVIRVDGECYYQVGPSDRPPTVADIDGGFASCAACGAPAPDSCLPTSWVTGDYSTGDPFQGDATLLAAGISPCTACLHGATDGCTGYPYAAYISGNANGNWTFDGLTAFWLGPPFSGPVFQPYQNYSPNPDHPDCNPFSSGPDLGCDNNCPVDFIEGIDCSAWRLQCVDAATKKYVAWCHYLAQGCLQFYGEGHQVQNGDGSATLTIHNQFTACHQPYSLPDGSGKSMGSGGTVTVTWPAPS